MSKKSIRTLSKCLVAIITSSYIMLGVGLALTSKAKNPKYEEPITPIESILSDYSSEINDGFGAEECAEPIKQIEVLKYEEELVLDAAELEPEPELEEPGNEPLVEPEPIIEPEPTIEPAPEPEPFYYDVPLSHTLQDYLFAACATYGVPVPLALAIIEVESDFHPNEISSTHDYGLLQINRCNFSDCRKHMNDNSIDFLDSITNIECGIWLFSIEYHAENENATLALMRYNNGPTGARRKWAKGIYETAYTRKVLKALNKYELMGV